jgi:alpha-ribazole phosphatase
MFIGLLRHGEVAGGNCFRGHTDDPLTAKGLEQMYSAITDCDSWDCIISSPLMRCAKFAKLYAQQYSLPLTIDDRLHELNFGTWEGRTAAELMAEDQDALTRFWNDPEKHPPPDGETLSCFQARILEAWSHILATYSEQRVLVVTHGGVIRVLLCHVLARPLAKLQEFEIKHGGLYSLQVDVDNNTTPASETITQV